MPDNQAAKRDYDRFVARFSSDDFVLVTGPECKLDDPRLERLAIALEQHPGVPLSNNPQETRLIRQAYSGSQMLREMTNGPLSLSEKEALRRLTGVLIGPDAESTVLIVQLSKEGRKNQRAAIDLIKQLARKHAGLDLDALRMGGTVFEATSMEIEIERTLHNYVLPIFLVTFVITWWFLRSIRQVVIVLSVAFYCRCLSLALVYYAGHKLSVVLSIMPVLVYVLAVSAGVHLVNYYRDALADGDVDQAPRKTLQAGWLPCTLATVTTMIGLLSLGLSSIVPVQRFGIYSALSMFLSLIVLLAVIPWALRFWVSRRELDRLTRQTMSDGSDTLRSVPSRLVILVGRQHLWVVLAFAILVLGAACGLHKITTSVDVEHMFSRQSALIRNYQWIEQRIGPLASIEVVVGFDEECSVDLLDRVALISEIETRIRDLPDVGGTFSTATFLPEVPEPGGVFRTARRSIYRRKVQEARQELTAQGYLNVDGDAEYWRITARVAALDPRHYEELITEVRDPVESVINARLQEGNEGITATYTGLVPMMQAAQKQVLDDLRKSLMMAAALICPVMIGILRSLFAGVLSMIPNLFPMVVVFGCLGWIGKPIDVGIMLTASVALGIAVDDTLHYLTWFARGIRDGLPRLQAIRFAYGKCAIAMAETTFICGFGLLPVIFIQFVPTREFALLLFTILLVALVGDLILLPAILAGPLGRVFVPRRAPTS